MTQAGLVSQGYLDQVDFSERAMHPHSTPGFRIADHQLKSGSGCRYSHRRCWAIWVLRERVYIMSLVAIAPSDRLWSS